MKICGWVHLLRWRDLQCFRGPSDFKQLCPPILSSSSRLEPCQDSAALDGSVTQLHTASFSFGNKDNKHAMPVTWDLEGASLSPLGMYLTRFPSFPSLILSLFFGTTFPCFLYSQFSFFFFLMYWGFPVPLLSWPGTEKVRDKQQSFANAKAIYKTQES